MSVQLIDSHTHLYLPEFDGILDSIMKRAGDKGVQRMLFPAIDSRTHRKMLDVCKEFPLECRPMMGLHPCSVASNYQDELKIVEAYLALQTFVGLGEIGLDFHWSLEFKMEQIAAFTQQMEMALQYQLPISIHSRNATQEAIELVKPFSKRGLQGVFHCFSGSVAQAEAVANMGFYLGIGGVLTFKNGGLVDIVQAIGKEWILLETDAPYLAPVPYRGKTNESSYLSLVAAKLADVWAMPYEEVAAITSANAQKLFKL